MSHLASTTLAALAAVALISPARAVDVALTLTSVDAAPCHLVYDDYYGEYVSCGSSAPASLAPAAPRGEGTLEFDAAGEFMRGALSLEAYAINASGVPAWSAAIKRLNSYTIQRADQALGPWPFAIPGQANPAATQGAAIDLTRFTAQDDFAGTLTLGFQADDLTQWRLSFAFASISGSGPPACPNALLLADEDGDGELNARDDMPDYRDSSHGGAVDADGRTIAEVCASSPYTPMCNRVDFDNDEPLRRKPGDCRLIRHKQGNNCVPGEFFLAGAVTLAPAQRTCLGFALVDDTDGDGEPDATDRCASTPAGAAIDGDGCNAPQFCAAQPVAACVRADFENDELGTKKPRDCKKTQTKPRACTVF